MTIGERIKTARLKKGLSQDDIAKAIKSTRQAVYKYETGIVTNIPMDKLEMIATLLSVTPAYLMGWEEEKTAENNIFSDAATLEKLGIMPLPKFKKIPLLGTIACGEPIFAEGNIEDYYNCPDHIGADFCLRCKGDSMIGARIHDGDIVYIKQQQTIENGEIAAVLIDGEATLKRVYRKPDSLILQPENPAYEPLIFVREEINEIRILGKAVCFLSRVK